MPKAIDLFNNHIAVVKGNEPDKKMSEAAGEPVFVDNWSFIFTDKTYGDQIKITFREETRDEIVRNLTGGIVLAGGNLPRV